MTLVDNRRARLSRYAPWIARDYFTNQGPATIIVLLLVGFLAMQGAGGPSQFAALPEIIQARAIQGLVGALGFLGTFFATNGIIANDRKFGYYKFLFSKPLSPLAYYALIFALYGLGLLIVTVVLLGIWSLAAWPMFPPELLFVVAVTYLAYGGIGFLLSAAWRFDWISLVTVLLVANVAWSMWGASEGLVYWALHLLPPVHRADELQAIILRAPLDVPWALVAWIGGYGLAAFVLGLLVLRRRSLASS